MAYLLFEPCNLPRSPRTVKYLWRCDDSYNALSSTHTISEKVTHNYLRRFLGLKVVTFRISSSTVSKDFLSILSTIPTWFLTVLLAITKRSSQVCPADNTPGGKRRRGGREYCKLHRNKTKIPKRKLRKSFYLKPDFSRFFAQSLSSSDQNGLGRLQRLALQRAPRAGRSEGRPPRHAPLTAAKVLGPATQPDPRVPQLSQPAALQVLCYSFS